jgi:hypothetical protein
MGQEWQQDHVEPFPNDVLLAADPINFLRVSHSKGATCPGDVRSLEYNANLGAVAAFPDNSARFHRKVIILDFGRYNEHRDVRSLGQWMRLLQEQQKASANETRYI